MFHKLALNTIDNNLGFPVWVADRRVSVASAASIDKATVVLDKGEMSFGMFDYSPALDEVVTRNPNSVATLNELSEKIGKTALPLFLIDYIKATSPDGPESLAIHTASSVAGYDEPSVRATISRKKGFIGKSQLELTKFPKAVHHIKIFYNEDGKARLFYKFNGSLEFIQNLKVTEE